MKILMILSNPFMVDPRVYKEAKALTEIGYEVTVIVWDRRGEYEKEIKYEGIRLIRIHNKGLMRIVNNDILRNPLWWYKAYKKGVELYNNGFKFDIVHCHDLDTLQAGVWLKNKFNIKLVYDAHELWGYLIEKNVPKFVVNKAFSMEKKLVKNTDHIITVSKPFLDYFKSISTKQVTLVMNCKDLIYKKYESPKNNIFTILYIGGMKKQRFFPEIIDIIGEIPDIRLILAGKTEDLYLQMKKYINRFSNVEFKGTIPTDNILPLTRSSDATFIIVDPTSKHYQKTLFNKQFEAMVCGRPIILTKGTYAAEMTKDLNCGLIVDYNIKSVRGAIKKLMDDPKLCEDLGYNAFKAAKEKYNWDIEKNNLYKVYEEIL